MVTPPKPPGSRQLISPPRAVFDMAPEKVLQGAVRLQGLASSPTPETQVRVAWALAGPAHIANRPAQAAAAMYFASLFISSRLLQKWHWPRRILRGIELEKTPNNHRMDGGKAGLSCGFW